MTSSLRVHMLHADRAGCADYRVFLPARAVNESSSGVRVTHSDHLQVDATRTSTGFRIRSVTLPPNVDVLVVQRPLKASVAGAMAWIAARRPDVALVVDLDDDLAAVPAHNPSAMAILPRHSPDENVTWLRRAIATADVLTASTPEIALRYGGGRGSVSAHVVRNGVPRAMTEQPARTQARGRRRVLGDADENRTVGWAGWTSTHHGDLEVMGSALADIVGADRTDGRRVAFRNIGPPDGLADALGLHEGDVGATGWLSTDLYRVGLGQLDVGVVPLADTRFNRSKSALKLLELSAAAVPTVVSATPEHIELRNAGLPTFIAKPRRRDWVKALRTLLDLDDVELRDAGKSAREFVRRKHTVEARVEDWVAAWRDAAERGATRRALAG